MWIKKNEAFLKSASVIFVFLGIYFLSPKAYALDLLQAYEISLEHDFQFQGAKAEFDVNQAFASQAKTAYLPEARYSRADIPTQTTPVQTISVTQPIIHLSQYAVFKQAQPRAQLAQSTFSLRKQELITRLLLSVTDLIRARERANLNQTKIITLEQQSTRAKRLYELGHGTVTDLRDVQVKYDQAKADQITNEVKIRAAERAFILLTGIEPEHSDFILPHIHTSILLEPLHIFSLALEQTNPILDIAKKNVRLKELEAQRILGNALPTVSAAYSRSSYSNTTNITTGFMISVPLIVGNYYANSAAVADIARVREEHHFKKEKIKNELEHMYALVKSGQEALKIKRRAIDSAELSVEANNKSYEAGLRSNVDILNSIQVLFEVKNDYVIAVTQQAEYLLNLLLLSGREPEKAMILVQHFLFNY